jgi:hypothetical protein
MASSTRATVFLMDWVGGAFDPARFDLAAVKVELQRLR